MEDVKNLFNMGYFENIFVESKSSSKGLTLIYHVEEKPRIDSIQYKGHKAFSIKKLKEFSQLKKYEFLNVKKLKESIKNIRKQYEEKGYFLTEISYRLKKTKSKKKVTLVMDIQEGPKTLIKKINLIGNQHLSDQRIRSLLVSKEHHLLSFLTQSSVYTQEKIARDQQVIKYLYLEEGYLEVSVSDPSITLSPDKKDVLITFTINEGPAFRVGHIDFSGDLTIPKVELRKGLSLKSGEKVVYSKIQRDLMKIQRQYGDKGYAFANVIPRISSSENTLHIVFHIQQGQLATIHQIHITGNQLTRDKVVRRMFDMAEGELYHASKIEQARSSIQRLGYFDSVELMKQPLKQDDTKIDIEVALTEREGYGVFQVGGGYSSSLGFMLQAKLNKENLFGSGKTVGIDSSLIPGQKTLLLNTQYVDPYLWDTNWYLGINVFVQWAPFSFAKFCVRNIPGCLKVREIIGIKETEIATHTSQNQKDFQWIYGTAGLARQFVKNRAGGKFTIGRWMWNKKIKWLSNMGWENINIPYVTYPHIFKQMEAEGQRWSAGGSVDYDSRSDRLFPKNGIFSTLSSEYTYQIGKEKINNRQYVQTDVTFSHYINLSTLTSFLPRWVSQYSLLNHIVLKNKIQYGYLHSLSKGKSIPFDTLYLLGGPYSLRGFAIYSVGTQKQSEQNQYVPYGGSQQFVYNLELQAPLIPKARLYGNVFFDIGYAADRIRLSDLRKNVGFGVLLSTPMGPINLKWGFPLNPIKRYGEDTVSFHFNIGYDF